MNEGRVSEVLTFLLDPVNQPTLLFCRDGKVSHHVSTLNMRSCAIFFVRLAVCLSLTHSLCLYACLYVSMCLCVCVSVCVCLCMHNVFKDENQHCHWMLAGDY